MKKTDIAMIILIASMSILVSYFVTKSIMGDSNNKPVTIKSAAPISDNVEAPKKEIFNKDAINPTVEVTIGGSESPEEQSNPQTQ